MERSKGMKKKTKTHHNVGISIQELDTFLQTPETALETAQQEPGKLILGSCERRLSESQSCPQGLPLECIKSQLVISVHKYLFINCLIQFFYTSQLINYSLEFYISKKCYHTFKLVVQILQQDPDDLND